MLLLGRGFSSCLGNKLLTSFHPVKNNFPPLLPPPGTDAADVLLNRVIPLRIGYVAVVNRGQRDIDNNLTIREALRRESSFFKAHPVYRSLLKQCTTSTLTRMR